MDETKTLPVDLLRIDAGTQSRIKINEEVVEDYSELIAAGNGKWPFDPLDVFHDGNDYLVADGFHRTLAAKRAKRSSVPCNVHKGTARDAHIFGMTANDHHGLRMSHADKRSCVEWLLDNEPKMTQAEIADKTGVTIRTVRRTVSDRKPSVLDKEPPKGTGHLSGSSGGARSSGEEGDSGKEPKDKNPRPPRSGKDKPGDSKQYSDTFDVEELSSRNSEGIVDLAAVQKPYDEMLNARTAIVKAWNAVCKDARDGAYAMEKCNRVVGLLQDLLPPIAQARPQALCGECKGKGCKKCRNTGWWPRSVVEGLKK